MSDVSARLRTAIGRLDRLDLGSVQQETLRLAAARLKDGVRRALSQPPGPDHDAPWRQTGALQNGIEMAVEAGEAAVGSADPVAVDQEMGTRTIPPRPFLGPAAALAAPEIAAEIGGAVAAALREAAAGAAA